MKAPVSRSFVPAATLAMALLVSACGSDSPDALLASAQDYLSRNDAPAAIIQLKNVLKDRPDSAKARLLLAQALQATGDIAGAETEFRKAQDLGAAPDEVVPQLAQALLLGKQFGKITTDYALLQLASAPAQASLKTTVAIAWLRQGQEEKFRASIDQALKAKADHVPALIELVRASAQRGNIDEALAGLDKIPRQSSGADEAHKLRGDLLLYGKRDMDAAMVAYREALQVNPSYLEGQAAVVQLLLLQGKTEAAAEALQRLATAAPGKPQT